MAPSAPFADDLRPHSGSHLVWLGTVPDLARPQARAILTEHCRREHVSLGVAGYKVDEVDGFDEWLWPDHATFPSGLDGASMRQQYGLLAQRMLTSDLFRQAGQRTYGLVRASGGAASGYPWVVYSDAYDHDEYVTGISSASLCGCLWTPEVRSAETPQEWLRRFQTACLSPLAMLNAWASCLKPWSFPEVAGAVREAIDMRMRLLPYLYTAFAAYREDGTPPFRAMLLEDEGFADVQVARGHLDGETDPYALDRITELTNQYMLGPDLLVAPFSSSHGAKRTLRLPPGDWYDFYSGDAVGGGAMLEVDSRETDNRVPIFVRGGSLVPLLAEVPQSVDEVPGMHLEVRSYAAGDGATVVVYEDDGHSFDYESGACHWRRLSLEGGQLNTLGEPGQVSLYGPAALLNMTP